MSILFVLLTFLLILSSMYFRRPDAPAIAPQPTSFQNGAVPKMLCMASSFPRSTRFIQVTPGFMTKVTSMRASGSTRSPVIYSARSTALKSQNSMAGFVRDRSFAL